MEIIVLILIISVLALIMYFSLKKLIEVINEDSKSYYFKTMQKLDKEIDEKNKKSEENNDEKEIVKNKSREEKTNNNLDKDLLDIFNVTDYESENALKLANKVDEIFNIDEEEIINKFVKNMEVDENNKIYQSILDRFSPNLIYKLKMLNNKSQVDVISKMLSDNEYKVFSEYLKLKKFNLNKFLLDLNLLIEKTSPFIEITTGNKKKNYNNISPYIKTTYSDDIYKGIIIKYQDKVYDYSINERDV